VGNGWSGRTDTFEGLKGKDARTKSRSMNGQSTKHDYIMLQKLLEHELAQNGYSAVFKTPRYRLAIDRQRNVSRSIWNEFLGMRDMGSPRKEQSPMKSLRWTGGG